MANLKGARRRVEIEVEIIRKRYKGGGTRQKLIDEAIARDVKRHLVRERQARWRARSRAGLAGTTEGLEGLNGSSAAMQARRERLAQLDPAIIAPDLTVEEREHYAKLARSIK